MEMSFFIKGVILGLSIAAPVGPMGVLCIRRTLSKGLINGFLSGLGTATADGIYGAVAAFSVTAISSFLLDNQVYLRLIGGIFLLYLGFITFKSKPAVTSPKAENKELFGTYTSALFLTLTNPLTIMSFAAVFAGLGIGSAAGNYRLAGIMVLGVFTGSSLWWLILSTSVNLLRSKFDQKRLRWVNQLSGVIISGFGVISLLTISGNL